MGQKIFLIICLIPSILSQCTLKKAEPQLKRAIYEFSIELLTRISQEKEDHFVASTLSPWTLLSCLSFGAADNTLAELKQVLKLHYHKCFNNKYLEIVRNINSNTDPDVIVERSSVIFADEDLPIENAFKSKIANTGISNVETMSLRYADAAASVINNYVSRATHDTIEEVITLSDLDDVYLLIVDALSFKGNWQTPFLTEKTKLSAFFNEKEAHIGDVNMMFINGQFHEGLIDQIYAQVVELPYGNSGRYSALFFLPYLSVPLNTVMNKLKLVSLTTIFNQLDEKNNVMVQIPRFKITSDMSNMRELLVDMGLESMFMTDQARFPYISSVPLSASDFFQNASIEVTEEGTGAGLVSKSYYKKFTANRPFMFMIVDKEYNVPILAGAYSKPSKY